MFDDNIIYNCFSSPLIRSCYLKLKKERCIFVLELPPHLQTSILKDTLHLLCTVLKQLSFEKQFVSRWYCKKYTQATCF